MERKTRLFVDSKLARQRTPITMSLVQSAKLHGHEPWADLKDVLTRLPLQLNSRIDDLELSQAAITPVGTYVKRAQLSM